MSIQYDNYLIMHKLSVKAGYNWLKENLPELFGSSIIDYEWLIGMAHDASKIEAEEYAAYDAYFYGGNKSFGVVREFNLAWLHHIHNNPHHWQHWILINDDPKEGTIVLDMPKEYVIEMICDWWAFSWTSGNLMEIFNWYSEHQEYIKLSPKTRNMVDSILYSIHMKLEEQK